eukprot:TRINITY_DN12798_c0_g1_i1.p1 TRINITY_DN12798_c0_g1~~TRINITY_DN12798_c0_g1_i1.p1  ORF type:complete len:215 (-),score=62.35 TRINITY_DN12798_c0_g1_i1:76-720(-)
MAAKITTLLVLFVGVLLVTLPTAIDAFQFDLQIDEEKCFSQELDDDTLVLAEYQTQTSYQSKLTVTVLDMSDNILVRKEDATEGTVAITTQFYGDYKFCFFDEAKAGQNVNPTYTRRVNFVLKHGVEAKDYSEVAKQEDLKPLEIELIRIEDSLDALNHEMMRFRNRGEVMQNTNSSTNARVLWFSVISTLILLSLGVWQIFYLKRYFRQKKLI